MVRSSGVLHDQARHAHLWSESWIDRLAAGAMGLLGVKILVEIRPSDHGRGCAKAPAAILKEAA